MLRTRKQRRLYFEKIRPFPKVLEAPSDYEALIDVLSDYMKYIDSIFSAATGRTQEGGGEEEEPSDEEADILCKKMIEIAFRVAEFWMEHADQMLAETDMTDDDASTDHVNADVDLMMTLAYAEATAIALGGNPHFEDATALSFPSVRRQKIAQTRKPICEYGPADLVHALDAISHNWHRIDINEDVFAYVKALRLQYGLLLRCATVGEVQKADGRYLTAPSKLSTGKKARLVNIQFREEMTYRFRAFLDSSWIRMMHPDLWTLESLRKTINNNRTQENDTCRLFDPERSGWEVLKLIRDYAKLVSGGGQISEHVQTSFLDFMIGPGDYDVYHARYPNAAIAPKNVVKKMRSNKFLSISMLKSILEPHVVLDEALQLAGQRQTKSDNFRSSVRPEDEVIGLCAFDCLMKARYKIQWRERFVVSRRTYRTAKELGLLNDLPVILVWKNTYDLLWKGRILQTGNIFESLAWWLEIIRVAYEARLPVALVQFKNLLETKKDQALQNELRLAKSLAEDDDFILPVSTAGDAARLISLTREMKRKATTIDLSVICKVTSKEGVASVDLKSIDVTETCVVLKGDLVAFR